MTDGEMLLQIAKILDALGPFTKTTPRHLKWRTTEQLFCMLQGLGFRGNLHDLEKRLANYEADYRGRLIDGLEPNALIRRAVYPDRTTALPLWGSTSHHGQPWPGQPAGERMDSASDIPDARRVSESAPRVFLSHAGVDEELAVSIAEDLAAMQIGAWMFENYVGSGQNIARSVRDAMRECRCCVALVTRDSIASLWILTELHSALTVGRSCILVVDASDDLLLNLLRSLVFKNASGMFDSQVEYDIKTAHELKRSFEEHGNGESRVHRYLNQVHDFLATLPLYLNHLEAPAFAYPSIHRAWSGPLLFKDFASIGEIIQSLPNADPPDEPPPERA
jgi:hypothetical protein